MPKLKKIPVRKSTPALDMEMDLDPMFPPSFHVTSKQMPEIKSWEVGEKYRLEIEVEQTGKRASKGSHTNADFEITGYRVVEKDYSKMSDEEFEEEETKALSS